MVTGKPLDGVLKRETYARQEHYALGVRSKLGGRPAAGVTIPVGVVWRLHYLARAFDCQMGRRISPGSETFDFYQMGRLTGELELIASVVNDPVTRHYLDPLLAILREARVHTDSEVVLAPVPAPQADGPVAHG